MPRNSIFHDSYRDIVAHYGLLLCGDHTTCRRKISKSAHRDGTSDTVGWVHLDDPDRHPNRRELRHVLVAIAAVILRFEKRRLPRWQRIGEANIWAQREARHRWGVLIPARYSLEEREYVARMAAKEGIPLRFRHPEIYAWARYPRRRTDATDDREEGA